jgi:hypothetical protein
MAASFLLHPSVDELVAIGLPPTPRSESEPIGFLGGLVLVAAFALAFWCAVRLVTWLDVKLGSWRLFRDIQSDLGIGGSRPRHTRRSSPPGP